MRNNLRRLRLALLLVLIGLGTFVLVTWAGERGADQDGSERHAAATIEVDEYGLPHEPYAALNPALVPALLASGDQTEPLHIAAGILPPIGIYLPATGDTQFSLPTATPQPGTTPPAIATSHQIPATPTTTPTATVTPKMRPTMPPTFTPGDIITPGSRTQQTLEAATAWGGDGCAPSGWPAPGILTQYYHWYHRAIDLGVPLNTPVVATHSGTVRFAGWRTDGYGNLIIIENGRFITYYAHLTDFAVTEGQIVSKGNAIGWSGSTGYSTGPHIHYEIRIDDVEVDPLTFEDRGFFSC